MNHTPHMRCSTPLCGAPAIWGGAHPNAIGGYVRKCRTCYERNRWSNRRFNLVRLPVPPFDVFTVGDTTVYDRGIARFGETFSKSGRDKSGYDGGYAFNSVEDARRMIKELKREGMWSVYALAADWKHDTVPSPDGWWHTLQRDAQIVCKIPEEPAVNYRYAVQVTVHRQSNRAWTTVVTVEAESPSSAVRLAEGIAEEMADNIDFNQFSEESVVYEAEAGQLSLAGKEGVS